MTHSKITLSLLSIAVIGLFSVNLSSKETKKESAAVARTRETVKMLDDVYKTAVVLITEHYVNDEDDLPAGSAAKALFAAINAKGWHKVEILDASGEPYNKDNTPKDQFDIAAVKSLKAGESFVDKVISKDGKKYLRAATPITVVMKKFIMCHENYKNAKDGEPIGILSYTIPIK